MKLELTPLAVEKAIEALQTMYEQTDRQSYLIAQHELEKQLKEAKEKKTDQIPALF